MPARELTANPGEVRYPDDGRARLHVDARGQALAWRDMMSERRQREAEAEREIAARSAVRRAAGALRRRLEAAGDDRGLGARLDGLAVRERFGELAEALSKVRGHETAVRVVREALAWVVPVPDPETLGGLVEEMHAATGATGGASTWT